ncbi:MAG: hypothetical protein C5B49_00870 [Bdellovibrio sp.]|nr:MAG: hypothetical protein C5B49_00870 [Bdellovibrio sp.]
MVKGYNSDLNIRGKSYHVQTEDWGAANPFLVSRVFANGAVVKTVKTSYTEALRDGPVQDQQALGLALRKQHQNVIDQLHAGQIR